MEWISVKERLPNTDGQYIVSCDDGDEPPDWWIWYGIAVIVAEYYDKTWTWNDSGAEYDITDLVTHWMPLPEPPKEVDKNAQN